ncbi:MAG: DUF5320 domain-containing protein [Deltaproteobacteria bacterium]|nr:DUF5320 domain-containing protein [Candidatus Anaeroferrophillus wilburensis]MBN2889136.1 DUF5320 domain-containing protein [Deltaproteobacteria bacterium]
MPGFDGTGPQGYGPMTGGGRGYCTAGTPGSNAYGFRRFGGRGFGFQGVPRCFPRGGGYDPGAELQFLQQQAVGLRQSLEQLDARIKQLSEQLQQEQQKDNQ